MDQLLHLDASSMTISAKILAYSRDYKGRYIVSWELEYPRFIHGEFMTHRLFSRNAASSRAIPVQSMIDAIRANPAKPIHWGQNQPGMQASVELEGDSRRLVQDCWEAAMWAATRHAEFMISEGAHKQIANRILEPFQTMKTVMTATCLDNFFWLRNHEDAQPEIKELARLMWEALKAATAFELKPGEWHLPYVHTVRDPSSGKVRYFDKPIGLMTEYTLEEALAVSSSCCAQVSYRKLDDTLEKAHIVFQRLVDSKPVHASPFEHQATPMVFAYGADLLEAGRSVGIDEPIFELGTTHMDRNGNFWSGNFIGFIQHRQLLDDHTCWEHKG